MKKHIEKQRRIVARLKKELEPLKKEESEARRLWSLGYNKQLRADQQLKKRIEKGLTVDPVKDGNVNKTVKSLWDTKNGWDEKSAELTKRRDDARKAMKEKEKEILKEESVLTNLISEYKIQSEKTDSVIDKVFLMNSNIVSLSENLDTLLGSEFYPLLSETGTQKTVESSNGLKKIVILSNTINTMDSSKVEEATKQINKFFDRINPKESTTEDTTITMLSELLKELLVVKTRVKPGPNLSKFLSLKLDSEVFPELTTAQTLLIESMNYQRTGKYIRLYERENRNDNWEPVRQS